MGGRGGSSRIANSKYPKSDILAEGRYDSKTSWAELSGSDKQNSWADSIRKTMEKQINNELSDVKRHYDMMLDNKSKITSEKWKEQISQYESHVNQLRKTADQLREVKQSKWFIEHRGRVENIISKSREKYLNY